MRVLTVIGVLLLINVHIHAQSNERIQRTWKGPDISVLWDLLKGEDKSSKPQTGTNPMRFTPAGDSGVPRALAEAFGSSAEQRASLVQAFNQIKQGYEAEVAKEGKSNNLAAAMTFFIAANVSLTTRLRCRLMQTPTNFFSRCNKRWPRFQRLCRCPIQRSNKCTTGSFAWVVFR